MTLFSVTHDTPSEAPYGSVRRRSPVGELSEETDRGRSSALTGTTAASVWEWDADPFLKGFPNAFEREAS